MVAELATNEPMVVLGGGNGALALAGDLTLRGLSIRLYEHPSFEASLRELAKQRTLVVKTGPRGENQRTAKMALITHDLTLALDGARLLHLVVPVAVQETFYRALLPHLTTEHCLIVWAGRFGTLYLQHLYTQEQQYRPMPFGVVEVNTLPYGARRTGPMEVSIPFRATQMFAATLPSSQASTVIPPLQQLFPVLRSVESVLEAAFRNSALPVLGVGTLLNAGAIESQGSAFALYRHGMTPSVRRAIRAVHGEMIAVGEALGFTLTPYPDAIYDGPASVEGANFRDEAGGTDGFLELTGPDRIYHRYTIENIRYGLAVIASLGHQRRVPTPTIDTLCALADILCGPGFARLGWSLADLGLG